MNNSNLIKDIATRNAVKKLEGFITRIESVAPLKVPFDADDTTRLIIQAINKITNNQKRNT